MLLDLKFSIGTLSIGSGAFIAGLYGMNLKNFIEESDLGFSGVTCMSVVFGVLIWIYGLSKLRRVQRVSMWGEKGGKSRRGRNGADLLVTLGDSRIERGRRSVGEMEAINEIEEEKEEIPPSIVTGKQ